MKDNKQEKLNVLKKKDVIKYQNEGIILIFNKLTSEYNLFINGIKEYNDLNKNNKKEKFFLLSEELSKSTLDDILANSTLEEENDRFISIIQDYYLYYITRNETLKRQLNDLENLCNIFKMLCNFQFGMKNKKKLSKNDFQNLILNLIMWTNDYYSELNEFLYCIENFHVNKIFNKKNIFRELLKKRDAKIDNNYDDIQDDLIGIKNGMEYILSVFNDLCLETPDFKVTKNIIEIIPNMSRINEKYNLNCKELYFLIQIKYIFTITNALNKDPNSFDTNVFGKYLRCLKKYRYSFKEDKDDNKYYEDLVSMFQPEKYKNDKEKHRYIIKILIQEYNKRKNNNKILDELLSILKNYQTLLKTSQLLFHEILSQYFNGTEIDLDKISNYNTDDYFLKLISFYSNDDYIEQILLEVFESKFNSHFMSYTNEINRTIKYEELSDEKVNEILKGKNLETFKKCIDLLEDPKIRLSNQRFLPNIVYCAYIKSYLYQFISYIFYKAEIKIDLSDVTNILTDGNENEFKTKERKVFEIYSFRILLQYLKNKYDAFKNFLKDKKYLNYKNAFKDKDSLDDQTPKIIEFCGITIEDFLNTKKETPSEQSNLQNFYTNTFLSIKIVCSAIKEREIINANEYKEIWDFFSSKLNGDYYKSLDMKYNYNDMYIHYFLSNILQTNLCNKIASNEFKLGNFANNISSDNLNNRTLCIIIYIIRFCLLSYSASGNILKEYKKQNYFYSRLIDYNSGEDINNIISNNFIPGRMNLNEKGIKKLSISEFCLLDWENKDNIINAEPKIELLTLVMLRFLFYSHLFVANLLGKISDSTFNSNYSVNEGYTCLRMLIYLWDTLNSERLIPGTETNKVQIFLNRVNKEILDSYEICEDFSTIEKVKEFEVFFNDYIKECLKQYDTFKLIYADKTMKAIIQQNNFPLSYGDDYPYMKYFVLISYPNIENLKDSVKGKGEKLCLSRKMMEYDEKLSEEKFKKNKENTMNNKYDMIYMDIATFSPYAVKGTKIFDLIINNKEIMNKYYKSLKKRDINFTLENFNNSVITHANNSNELSKKFFDNLIKELNTKNSYLYQNIRRQILSQNAINNESLVFDLDKISNYKSYPDLLAKYIYKDIFFNDKKQSNKYIDFEIKIDYNNYTKFDIDTEGLEDELESIILWNKRLFNINDYNLQSIYNFNFFRGKNGAFLNNFIRQYNKDFEYISCKEQINKIIDNKNIDIDFIRIFIGDMVDAYSVIFSENLFEGKSKHFKEFNELIKNALKDNLLLKLDNNDGINIKKQIIFNFIFCIYNNLLKVINFLIDKSIPLEISIHDFITNLPDFYNISLYTKYFFEKNREYKLKHLYYIFEDFEKYLFPFILLNVPDKYKTELYDYDKENIIEYFLKNKENIDESILTIDILYNILRKFISRYLASSDFGEEKYDINFDNHLVDYLDKKDLWPLDKHSDFREHGINELKEYQFLVQHSVSLYQCLTGIKFEYNGNIQNEGQHDIINESEQEYNFFKDLSYFNEKNSKICQMIKITSLLKEQELSNSFLFIFYNLQNNFIFPDLSKDNKSFIYLSYTNNGLCCDSLKLNFDEIDKIFTLNNISNFKNENLENIQNITHLSIIKENELFCIGTNKSKLLIVKLKDNFKNIELIQGIDLPDSCVNNVEIINNGKNLIIANGKNILLYELKDEEKNIYELKEEKLTTENDTNILKIDNKTIAAFISPNTIKIYSILNNKFEITREINDINFEISANNQKQYKTMNLIGKNNDIIAICSNENNIYLIDISVKPEKEAKVPESQENFERYSGDYDNWFNKHSSQKSNEKKEKEDSQISKSVDKEEIKINEDNNNNKIKYENWFEKHSKGYIIDKSRKKYNIINCSMKECKNNFVSVVKCYDDYIFLLDNTNKVIVAKIERDDENIENLNFIGDFDFHDIICFTPFGLYLDKK